jgi:beta-mannosidase
MEHHQRNASGNGKMITYLTDHFRLPKDFESLVYLTQLLQAEAMRVGVEHWRRNRECTSGALYWQLNDCWPVASWSSIDYFGRWKALHYAARRFYAPVLLSAEDRDTEVALSVTNDRATPWEGTVRWSIETLDGVVIDGREVKITAPALRALQVCTLDLSGLVTDDRRREVVLVYELWRSGERLSLGIVPFVPCKHLALRDPGIRCSVSQASEGCEIELTAENLARFVWLDLPGKDIVFSDNYFDVPAGRSSRVSMTSPAGLPADEVRAALRVRSLIDSFQARQAIA